MCEFRLGRSAAPELAPEFGSFDPKTVDELLACLRRIQKSIDFWNKRGGRQGYLSYVAQYVG